MEKLDFEVIRADNLKAIKDFVEAHPLQSIALQVVVNLAEDVCYLRILNPHLISNYVKADNMLVLAFPKPLAKALFDELGKAIILNKDMLENAANTSKKDGN